jgi:DNA topoisomerase-1
LGTAKQNYIDPRITVAFVKKHKIPIDKVFSKTLQEKFKWAIDIDENFSF